MKHTALLILSITAFIFTGCGGATTPPQTITPTPLPTGVLSNELLAEGWISLFDGESLYGWKKTGDANFRVEDGAIVVDEGDKCFLLTTTAFADYELHIEFAAAEGANSGVFLHTTAADTQPATNCYELNIAPPDNPFPTGSLVQRQKVEGIAESNQWRAFDISVVGPDVTVSLDGKEILKYTDENPLIRGPIGLQHNEGQVSFRNIRIRPLGLESLFNGKDLAGWKEYPDMESKFSVTKNGELQVINGSGQLETEASFADFAMQLECKTNAPNLNSGIFFRCIPGEKMNGYESQIHNGYENGDRTKPVDAGTGAIFRRQPARVVAANDQQWFSKTIIAHNNHVSVWVNGLQVVDWNDDREPHENPRKGLRTKAGAIMIQGHDPTTDILFRNLRAGETPQRKES